MKCFAFFNGEKKDEPKTSTKSLSVKSSFSTYTDRDIRRSESEFNSQEISDLSEELSGRATFPSFSQRPDNLRVFTFSDLKSCTKNFGRSVMIGEGGFGCVYKGVIRSLEDQQVKIDVAVKQLSRKGHQLLLEYKFIGSGSFCTPLLICSNLHEQEDYTILSSRTQLTWKLLLFDYKFIGSGSFCTPLQICNDLHEGEDYTIANSRTDSGHKEWVTEVNVLGVVDHPNLVKLVGYCAEDDERGIQRLLVYEYMPNRSVEDHLSTRSDTPLSWIIRLRIALDAARGLVYLHEEMDFQIIFRDFKTSNILLDEQWNAKLSDFGLARQGPLEGLTHVSTAVVGTMGYAAPEYIQTGRLSSKSDVWSYGVVLYELITGRRPLDRNRPKGEQKLLEWIKPYLSDVKKFHQILDPRIRENFPVRSAYKLAGVANRCLVRQAKARPKMSEVLEMVKNIIESAELGDPELPMRNTLRPINNPEEAKRKRKKPNPVNIDSKTEANGWYFWRPWTAKLVEIC